ncbi:uncharacterized protein Bfra_001042 [Botrytis fragariae]|uniref:Uncharacterized protein n=1 Tax=Botrytis fragariae TaxID=1964551 RepID=A0A8H6B3S6_9HELO|nr:uncharacterized protein Bfra_001042 [Botrytis fragariae]KAF5878871.1 hypothetical protein Bfra_001042 [Botrytis fragariae]
MRCQQWTARRKYGVRSTRQSHQQDASWDLIKRSIVAPIRDFFSTSRVDESTFMISYLRFERVRNGEWNIVQREYLRGSGSFASLVRVKDC